MQVAASAALLSPQAPRISGTQSMLAVDAIAAFGANPKSKIEVRDTAANISANFDGLTRMGVGLTKVTVQDPSNRITLTAAQYASGAKTLGAIKSSFTLKVTGVGMDQLNAVTANNKVSKVEVSDTSANIGASFSKLLNQPNKIDKITQTGTASPIAMSGDMFSRSTAQTLLTKIQGSYTLALSDVKVADLANATGSNIHSVAIKDTSAHISSNLASGNPTLVNSKVTGILQSDAMGSISITDTKFQALSSTLAKLAGTSSLAVTGVTAARAALVANNAYVKSVSVTDTAANINSNSGANATATKISEVNVEDTGASFSASLSNILTNASALSSITKIKLSDAANISITGAQLKNDAAMALLGKVYGSNDVKGNYNLTATGVLAADVNAAARFSPVNKIQVSDSVTHALSNLTALNSGKVDKIDLNGGTGFQLSGANLDKLDAFGAKLNSVSSDGTDITISYDQYVKRSATLAKIDSGDLIVTNAGASATKQLSDDTSVGSFTVKDSAAKLTANFADLKAAVTAGKLTSAKLTDNAAITLTATQFSGASALLDKVQDEAGGGNFKLQLTGATASNLVGLYTSPGNHFANVTKVSISDTSDNIAAKLDDLGDAFAASKLGDIRLTGAAADIAITKTQLDTSRIAGALGKISGVDGVLGNYSLDVSAVSAADASALVSGNTKVNKVSIADSSANITDNLADIAAITASKLKAVTVSDFDITHFGDNDITVASSNLAASATVLGKVTGGDYSLNVTDVSAAGAKLLTDTNAKVSHLTVKDNATSITGKLADLNTLTDGGKLTAISFIDPTKNALILTNAQYNDGTVPALTILNNDDYKLSVSGVSVAEAVGAANVNTDTHVTSYSVKDTGGNIELNLGALDGLDRIQSINWTDTMDGNGPTALNITGQDYHDFIGTLSKINAGQYNAHVTDLSAADTVAAESDANISEFSVKDTAEHLGANLAALQASADAGTSKIQAIEQDGPGDVAMTAAQYTDSTSAFKTLLSTAATPITITVSGVAAGDVDAVINDADVSVTSISVSDTASNIVAKLGDGINGGDLDTNAAKITGITVSDDDVLALTGAQYADNVAAGGILDKLSQNTGGYHATITDLAADKVADATGDTNVDSFAVSDDAAGLGANFADLVAAGDKLMDITQSDTDPVPIALSDLVAHALDYANTLAKFGTPPGVTLS